MAADRQGVPADFNLGDRYLTSTSTGRCATPGSSNVPHIFLRTSGHIVLAWKNRRISLVQITHIHNPDWYFGQKSGVGNLYAGGRLQSAWRFHERSIRSSPYLDLD